MLEDVRAELLEMVRVDQDLRFRFMAEPQNPELRREILETDARHTARLEAMVEEHGWPGISSVGQDGAFASWMLAQHADQRPEFQARCLGLMGAAVDMGEAESKLLAYLHDRVCMHQKRPQRYGTQIRPDALEPFELEDPARVDERRKAVGLEPLAAYLETVRRR